MPLTDLYTLGGPWNHRRKARNQVRALDDAGLRRLIKRLRRRDGRAPSLLLRLALEELARRQVQPPEPTTPQDPDARPRKRPAPGAPNWSEPC